MNPEGLIRGGGPGRKFWQYFLVIDLIYRGESGPYEYS